MLSSLSRVQLFVTPWTVARQPTGFSRQEHWRGWPVPPPGGLPNCVPGASQIFLPEYPTSTPNQNAQNLILSIRISIIHIDLSQRMAKARQKCRKLFLTPLSDEPLTKNHSPNLYIPNT